jgi:2-deoxy-D-gluconate 3-dehydrogenase
MPNMFDLSGRVAIITGGNGGIGLGMATGLAEAGASVMIAARNPEKNQAATATLKAGGADVDSMVVDVTDESSCRAMVRDTVNRFGRVDILVNNAGTNIRKQPQDYTLAEWRTLLDTNLTSAFLCSQAVYPELRKAGGGKIINIGSIMSIFGAPFVVPYSASKGGMVQMTKSLATAWAADNIQVNAVLPGWIDTDLTRAGRKAIPELHDRVVARCPAGRWGVPEDLAGIGVFLAGPASQFVTGTAIPVDGGYSIQGF